MYLEHLLPEIAAPGDDHNYGSSAMNDVTALQASEFAVCFGTDGCALSVLRYGSSAMSDVTALQASCSSSVF